MVKKFYIIKKILTNTGPKILNSVKKKKKKFDFFLASANFINYNKKRDNKIFYLINRSPGSGLFSNITFILNHLKICENFNFIPIIDMENFTTIYNEKNKIQGKLNAWEYYFYPLNRYSLKRVIKNKNVILSSNKIYKNMVLDMTDKNIKTYFNKYIKIKKKYINISNKFYHKNFNNSDKILGVHFRGSTYKVASGHAYPPTPSLIIQYVNKLLKKYNYNKIFLVTEEEKYLDIFKKKYQNKLLYCNSYRMNDEDLFKIYPRNFHRFKLGEETLVDTLILSKCNGLAYVKSNIISAAKLMTKKKQKYHEMFLGYNSRNKYIARWLWYIKSVMPKFLYGLKFIKKKSFNLKN